jgi:putative ABC transport system permease protein
MLAVRESCEACSEVGALTGSPREMRYGRTRHTARVMGITANVPRIGSPRDVVAGRPLIEDDVDRARAVGVVGSDVAEAFFGLAEPLGKEIQLGEQRIRVVGVAEKKGTIFGQSQDNFVWVPITFFRKLYGQRSSIDIVAEARTMAEYERAQEQARTVLRGRRHLGFAKPDDFSIETGESVMELWQSATSGIYVTTTIVVTAISLLVGGVVVMNIMLVSVTERIHEIGIRKALGARRRDILRQFLVESIVLSVLGGALGVLGATAGSKALAMVLGSIMSVEFTAPVQLWAVALALFVSGTVGLLAGIYPASRAARLDPVEALRNE